MFYLGVRCIHNKSLIEVVRKECNTTATLDAQLSHNHSGKTNTKKPKCTVFVCLVRHSVIVLQLLVLSLCNHCIIYYLYFL